MTKLRDQMNRALIVRGYSEATRTSYLNSVFQLAKYYRRSPDAINGPEIEKFLLHLIQKRHLCKKSINCYVAGLRFFYQLIYTENNAPAIHIPTCKQGTTIPDILSTDEVRLLFEHTQSLKYRVIFMIAYGSGLRISEIMPLTIQDIDSQRMLINIRHGKSNKQRYALLSPSLLAILRQYWLQYRPKHYLFPGQYPNKPLSAATVQQVLRKIKKKIGITKNGGIHALRHSFATHLLEEGVDIFIIKQLLGHKYINATALYLRASQNRLRNVISPLDRLLTMKPGK